MASVKHRYASPADMTEVDYVLLADLPPEGAKLGYHNIGVTVAGLGRKFGESIGGSAKVAGRLRSLQALGFTTTVQLHGEVLGWQVTPLGMSYVAAWRSAQNEKDSPNAGSED